MRFVLFIAAGLSVGACSVPDDNYIALACTTMVCGEGSTCQETRGVATCVCDPGFQDKDGDGTCSANCDEMTCGSRMSCDDSSGTASCVCNAGFQDVGGTCMAVGLEQCELTCGTNAVCLVRNGVGACECTGAFVDFDGDGNCTATCSGANLLNGTLTGGAASVVEVTVTGNYQNNGSYVGTDCNGHRDASGILCDTAPFANSATTMADSPRQWSGPRFTSFGATGGAGVVVVDAGSSITFNTLELFQHFRYYGGGLGNSRASAVRYSVHASTTTAPSATDAGWVTLTSGFDAVPAAVRSGGAIRNPAIWNGAIQTSRFIRVEVQGNQTYRAGFRGLKGFLCQ